MPCLSFNPGSGIKGQRNNWKILLQRNQRNFLVSSEENLERNLERFYCTFIFYNSFDFFAFKLLLASAPRSNHPRGFERHFLIGGN